MIPLLVNLGVTALAVALTMLATMAVSLRTRVFSGIDVVWGLGFVVIAAVSALTSFLQDAGDPAVRLIALALTAVWGLFLLACSHWSGLLTLVAPLLMTHILVNKSGKALLERQMSRRRGPEYTAYVARTSGFFPRPPRRN